MAEANIPADYAIDALSMEAERRSKMLGRPYSYGQLVADTTPEQRESIVERYREQLVRAKKKGRYRVYGGTCLLAESSAREIEDAVINKLDVITDTEKAGE